MVTRRAFCSAVGTAVLAVLLCNPQHAAEQVWKVGTAKIDITPDKPLWMAGYAARTRPAEGTLHPLWVKVLALEGPKGERAVILTSDILGFPRAMSERITAALTARYKLDRSALFLTSSHTHSGPVLSGALLDIYPMDASQLSLIDEYSARLERNIVETVGQALSRLAPARLYTGRGKTSFAVNRRGNREAEVPKLLEQGLETKGPVEHSVPVLAVRGDDGTLVAVLFSYACHATTLDGYQWCGDYPGYAQVELESRHPGALAMFHAGCGADQNPIPRRSVALCEKYGLMLAEAVEKALGGELAPLKPGLATAFRRLKLDYERHPTREELKAIASAPDATAFRKRWAGRLLRELDAGTRFDRSYPYPVQVWLLGGSQLWIGLGGEVVVDYTLRLKREFGPDAWVTGYANDVMAYIPSARIQAEGGYESSSMDVYGLPATGWASGIEDRVASAVGKLVRQVRNR
jgi:hypothetical protein